MYLDLTFAVNKGKEIKAKIKGEPTPKELEQAEIEKQKELKELAQLEKEKEEATAAAKSVSEVVEMIKQDPIKAAEKLGVELSEEEIKQLKIDSAADEKPTSKAIKFEPTKRPKKNDADQ